MDQHNFFKLCRQRWHATLLGVLALAWFTTTPAQATIQFTLAPKGDSLQPKLALVIGVSDYNGDGAIDEQYRATPVRSAHLLPDLKNPVADAQLIRDRLTSLGFFVHLSFNPTREQMLEDVAYFRHLVELAGPHAISITYFAGHGIQFNGTNYMLPSRSVLPLQGDSPATTAELESLIAGNAIGMADLLFASSSTSSDAAHVVVLDACRNNPWAEVLEGLGFPLRKGLIDVAIQAPRTLLVFSTSPGEFAADGAGNNSPFATALSDRMEIRSLDNVIEEYPRTISVFKDAAREVAASSQGRQIPYLNGPVVDEVCLHFCVLLTRRQMELLHARHLPLSAYSPMYEGDPSVAVSLMFPEVEIPDEQLLGATDNPRPDWTTGFANVVPKPRP